MPLASRITAKESEALLDLLLLDGGGGDDNDSHAATASNASPVDTADTAATSSSAGSSGTADGQQLATVNTQPRSSSDTHPASSSEMLDDVIGLLNEPECKQLISQQQQQCSSTATPTTTPPLVFSPLPPAACREAHRQAYVRPLQQQQPDLRAAADKHASISAAWRGFYSYWGPHAASTIQHYWRAYRAKRRYLQLREAAVVLQAGCRGHLFRGSPANLLRLHREEQQRLPIAAPNDLEQQQQRREEEERQLRQREEELLARELLLLKQQQQQHAQLEAATVVLQCAVRGWSARCLCRQLADTAAEASASAAGAGPYSRVTSICSNSRQSDSSSGGSSRGSSRQSHSRGSTVCSSSSSADMPCGAAALVGSSSQAAQEQPPSFELYELPGLLIRSAADTRTASHGGGVGGGDGSACCTELLAQQLVQRAGVLGVAEGLQTAELATRALMASSSSRQLASAMSIVRSK